MKSNNETFETWNKIAGLYEEKFMPIRLYDETYDFICNNLTTNQNKILELGCGPGNISKYLLGKRPDFNLHGIDIAPNMIELAKKNNPTAHFSCMDIRNIGELKEKFDALVGGFCIPFLSAIELEKFVFNSSNLLQANGLFYLSFVAGEAKQSGFKTGSSGDRIFFNYHPMQSLVNLLQKYQFLPIQHWELNYPSTNVNSEKHQVLVSIKK